MSATVNGLRRQVDQLSAAMASGDHGGGCRWLPWTTDEELRFLEETHHREGAARIAALAGVEMTTHQIAFALARHYQQTLGANHRPEDFLPSLDRDVAPGEDARRSAEIEAAASARMVAGLPPASA